MGERDKSRNENLISIKGTMSYDEIRLSDKPNKTLLSFYSDSEHSKAVWLDGLRMLKGWTKDENLSAETTQHIRPLQELRKNTQLLILEGGDFAPHAPMNTAITDDADSYDMEELVDILKDLFNLRGTTMISSKYESNNLTNKHVRPLLASILELFLRNHIIFDECSVFNLPVFDF